MNTRKREKIILCLILFFFLLIKVFHLLNQKGIAWDSAVYIEMGKYILSFGKVGLWEPARPLIWPIFLGFLWKIGLNPLIFGPMLEAVFSLGCLYFVYLIGKNVFNEKIALLTTFFLAFSPTFLFYSSGILTDIPSTLFALIAIYFLIKDRYFLTGLFIGLSFMTRFLQLFILPVIIIFLLIYKKDKIKKLAGLAYGFFVLSVPYLILNMALYKNPIYPFLLQVFMSKYTGWVFHQPISFYFINLFNENFLILFAIAGIILILRRAEFKKINIFGIFLLFFVFFNSIAHKETRFILVFLPYLYLIASYGIFEVFSFKWIKKKKRIFYLVVIVLGIFWAIQEIGNVKIPKYKEYTEFQRYIGGEDVEDGIWVSNPIFVVNSNKKPDELIYYPLYNSKKIDGLREKISEANHILIDSCDILPCPGEDMGCYNKTNIFLDNLGDNFKLAYYKKIADCEQFIFRR